MKTKVTYVISGIDKSLSFEWVAELINKQKFELNFVLLQKNNSLFETYLKNNNISVKRIPYKNKYHLPKAIIQMVLFLLKNKSHVVHAHLFDASLVALTASWMCGIKKRIYTRHHSTFHHDYFPKIVKYDRLCNNLSTHIVAVTNTVKYILEKKEHVNPFKIKVIHHGFKLELFDQVASNNIELLKTKYSIHDFYPVVGVVSRYTEWKGVQYTILAFKKLLAKYPNAKLILANAQGDYKNELHHLLNEIPKKNFIEINFENDLFTLFKLFDVFVHVPIDKQSEAFGQVYIEALASKTPSIVTLSGIANDFIKHKHNAFVVNYKDSQAIFDALLEVLSNETLRDSIKKQGQIDVNEMFPVSKMINDLESLYLL